LSSKIYQNKNYLKIETFVLSRKGNKSNKDLVELHQFCQEGANLNPEAGEKYKSIVN
jgi:hypothetical protein